MQAGICLLSLGCLGYLAFLEGDTLITLLAVSLSGAIFGFLRFNTFPATVFMGDTGSQLIGFSVIALALNLTQGQTPLSPLLPLLIIGFPIIDTATVMVERLAHRRPLFAADKNHLHHKLIGFGLFHTEAVLVIYLVQAAFVVSAFVFRFYSEWVILSLYLFLSLFFVGGLLLRRAEEVAVQAPGSFRQGDQGTPEDPEGKESVHPRPFRRRQGRSPAAPWGHLLPAGEYPGLLCRCVCRRGGRSRL